ncbi:MAG: hypothetical protein H6680_06795 [Desulfobacteraceae bacterium]|nr:hypothetical protein [Desulfobacteraceae bacterium]
MKDIFTDLNAIENVHASLFFTVDGDLVLYESSEKNGLTREMIEEYSASLDWKSIHKRFKEINEAELLFTKFRVYMRKADHGFIVILMSLMAPIEIVRLNIDLIMPEINSLKKNKGFGRFFKFRS